MSSHAPSADLDNSLPVPPADDNMSFVLEEPNKVKFERREVKPPAEGEVVVNIRQTGICGSDVHYWKEGRIGDFVVTKPMVLGHESAGVVVKVGPGVTDRKVGDRVALEPGVPCRRCDNCKAGLYNVCPDMVFAATPPYDGTLATYYNLASDFAHPVPDHMSLEEASLMEPLSVAVYATAGRGEVRAGHTVVVFGAGPVGLLCAAVAKAYGASQVVVVDIVDAKVEFAKEYCATHIFKPGKPREGESKMEASERGAKELKQSVGGKLAEQNGADLVVEATGAAPCIQMAAFLAKARGRVVQVGMGSPNVELPITSLGTREVVMTGSFRYGPGTYKTSIDLVARGLIDVKKIVTHRYTFQDTIKAFEAVASGKGDDGKPVIKVQISQGAAPPP